MQCSLGRQLRLVAFRTPWGEASSAQSKLLVTPLLSSIERSLRSPLEVLCLFIVCLRKLSNEYFLAIFVFSSSQGLQKSPGPYLCFLLNSFRCHVVLPTLVVWGPLTHILGCVMILCHLVLL